MCCSTRVCVFIYKKLFLKKKEKKKTWLIRSSHSFYRSLCVAQIVVKAGRAPGVLHHVTLDETGSECKPWSSVVLSGWMTG